MTATAQQLTQEEQLLATLLNHPEILEGIQSSYKAFAWDCNVEGTNHRQWDESNMMSFMTLQTSEESYLRSEWIATMSEGEDVPCPHCSYLHCVGLAIGYLAQVLQAQQQ